MNSIKDIQLKRENVFVRGDLDVDIENGLVKPDRRLEAVVRTIKHLMDHGAYHVTLAGHRGRPEGNDPELSLKPLLPYLRENLGEEIQFVDYEKLEVFSEGIYPDTEFRITLFENLRFWEGEEKNDLEFAKKILANFGHYVNEAFASSHREHSSIVSVPNLVRENNGKVYAGLQFEEEVQKLGALLESPKRPLITILSGVKEDKLRYLEAFKKFSDKILVGGRLPIYLGDDYQDEKVVIGRLNADHEDITINSIERFEKEVENAGTIVVAGPIGKYEDIGDQLGTKRVFEKVANSSAYKVAGGGDTEYALRALGIEDKFDWVSVGGGAMLDYLADGSLPGIEPLKSLSK